MSERGAARRSHRSTLLGSLPFRLAATAAALLFVWGTAVRALMLFYDGLPQRHQWVHFGLGTGYEVMSASVAALLVYSIALVSLRTARGFAFVYVTATLIFNYVDYVYFQLFLTHLPFSSLEYLDQLSNFASSIWSAVFDIRFFALVVLPIGLSAWTFVVRKGGAPPSGWTWKRHATALGMVFLVGGAANTVSNSYVGKNPENVLQFTPLQHFLATRVQLQNPPAALTPAVLGRLAPPDPTYPLLHDWTFAGCAHPSSAFRELCAQVRTGRVGGTHPPNIVFIMIESFRAQEIGVLGGGIASAAPGTPSLTPNFDALAQQGILFRNFFGNGFQTRHGLVSSYCSIFPNTGQPILGSYQRVKERCLPELLAARGYRTLWLHNGDAEFDGQRGFLLQNGVQRVLDRWDFPLGTPTAGWGVTDEALMDRAITEFRSMPQPFFAALLTITNHHPFEVPAGFSHHGSDEYGRFLDTMAYTDRALGQFFDKARREPFFQNTIFFLYADHAVPQPAAAPVNTVRDDLAWRHRIPLLIVAAGIHAQIVDTPGSQVDLPPLTMDLLGGQASLPWEGQSPVDGHEAQPAVVIYPGNYVGAIGTQGAARWRRGTWEVSGILGTASRQWAEDITLATRWALENDRVTARP